MRSIFPGFYRPTQEEFAAKFKDCIFSFDTNVLLNLYRFTPASQDQLLKVLQHDKIKGRVWLSHQVGYEYHDNRVEVIIGQREIYGALKKAVDKAIAIFDEYRRSGNFQITALIEPIRKALEQVKADLDQKKADHPDLLKADPILDALAALFDGKVGPEYPAEEHKKKVALAKARFDAKQPPGYLDSTGRKKKEGDKKYGDVLVWFQLLDFAKKQDKPVILITDETGEDWWLKDDRKTLGPRPELMQEMHKEAGRWFYMYSTEQFLQYSKDLLELDVRPDVIKEAKEIKEEDEERTHAADPKTGGEGSALGPRIGGLQFPVPSGLNLSGYVGSALDVPRFPVPDLSGVVPKVPDLSGLVPKMPDMSGLVPRMPDMSGLVPKMPDLSAALGPITAASGVMADMSRALAPVFEYQRQLEQSTSGLTRILREVQEREARLLNPLAGVVDTLRRAQETQERLMNPLGGVAESLRRAQAAQERLVNPFGAVHVPAEEGLGEGGNEQEVQDEDKGQQGDEQKPKE